MDPLLFRLTMLAWSLASDYCDQPPRKPLTPAPVKVTTETPAIPFEWSYTKKEQFLEKLKKVKRGDHMEQVTKLLGPPYAVEPKTRKESEDITGTCVYYFLKRSTDDLNGSHNQYVILGFDINNRFVEHTGALFNVNSEIAEAKKRDTPAARPKSGTK